ncbi:MAG: N-acetylmuramoyl-L-alanine amidase [Acidimicrobiia bacterium]|nr:N-acetylmuramoyl-L-alanine amidase [Acidimicrobiia bacterium]
MAGEFDLWEEIQRQESKIQWLAGRHTDPVKRLRYLRKATAIKSRPKRWKTAALTMFLVLLIAPVYHATDSRRQTQPLMGREVPPPQFHQPPDQVAEVWLVERKAAYEVYSNGLRIETGNSIPHDKRSYASVSRSSGRLRTDGVQPAGIVYHTTESHITTFEEGNNARLQRVGQWLVEYVKRQRSYHYVVDRFGRVHRVVEEEYAADHAGGSMWADQDRIYLGLNHSFLGVALESQTTPGADMAEGITDAQLHATKVLTEMLRSKYGIPSGNCVTHAQVSVNARSYRIGNHTDWAANFPYQRVGLPDNYQLPLASMVFYGFGYGQEFVDATGSRMWNGLAKSEEHMRQSAAGQAISVPQYRTKLQQHFRQQMAELPESPGTGKLRTGRRTR